MELFFGFVSNGVRDGIGDCNPIGYRYELNRFYKHSLINKRNEYGMSLILDRTLLGYVLSAKCLRLIAFGPANNVLNLWNLLNSVDVNKLPFES